MTRRGFTKQDSGDIEYAVARKIVLHIAGEIPYDTSKTRQVSLSKNKAVK